jgi:hypothetical protein
MRRTDTVFLLTLIDFLFQIIFFGVFLYAIYMATTDESKRNSDIKRLQSYFGIGDLTVLTDELTRLGPIEEIRKALKIKLQLGDTQDAEAVAQALAYIEAKGGKEKIDQAIRKLEEGAGKPHCITFPANKKVALELAEVTATDERIVFSEKTEELSKLLKRLNINYSNVRDLSFQEFQSAFRPVLDLEPNCRYTLRFVEKTDFVHARTHVEPIFYLRKIRSGR